MTNAIEQAKREMYTKLAGFKMLVVPLEVVEDSLESYLELLRQDHEALHETARKRFEDLQVAEEKNQELQRKNDKQYEIIRSAENTAEEMTQRLAKMTEERDAIQLRLHAVDHAYRTQQERSATPTQDSGDRASCEATESNADVILAAVHECKRQIEKWGSKEIKAKKAIRKVAWLLNGDPKVESAIRGMNGEYKIIFHARFDDGVVTSESWHKAEPVKCQHSFFAIGQDQMKCTFCGVVKLEFDHRWGPSDSDKCTKCGAPFPL